jgi:hypothetical protein
VDIINISSGLWEDRKEDIINNEKLQTQKSENVEKLKDLAISKIVSIKGKLGQIANFFENDQNNEHSVLNKKLSPQSLLFSSSVLYSNLFHIQFIRILFQSISTYRLHLPVSFISSQNLSNNSFKYPQNDPLSTLITSVYNPIIHKIRSIILNNSPSPLLSAVALGLCSLQDYVEYSNSLNRKRENEKGNLDSEIKKNSKYSISLSNSILPYSFGIYSMSSSSVPSFSHTIYQYVQKDDNTKKKPR